MTDEAILNELIANVVLYLEAEKQGLVVSDDEVDQYLDILKIYFTSNKDADVITLLREFVSGKGMTLNDYIDSLKPGYKQLLLVGQVEAKYITGTKTIEEYKLKLNQLKEIWFLNTNLRLPLMNHVHRKVHKSVHNF